MITEEESQGPCALREPALNRDEAITWGKKLYAEAQGVSRSQLEEAVSRILGSSQVNGFFAWDNLTASQLKKLNLEMFWIARFSSGE